MDVKQLYEERRADHHAVLDGIIPKRVPINISIGAFALAEYAGINPRLCYWDTDKLEEKAFELARRIPSDSCILGRTILTPAKYQALGSESIKMSSNGFMQHPNTHMMEPEEYDAFIEDPYAFIVEKAVPRVNKALDFAANPGRAAFALLQADMVTKAAGASSDAICRKLNDSFGYFANPPVGGGGYAPMDILSDQLRSFSGMLTDIRRCRSKVAAAVEAVSPLNYFVSEPANPAVYTRYSYGFYPLHMATFMRTKDFEELWWPAFKRQWDGMASSGYRCSAFLEHNWDHLLDYLTDLPVGSVFTFEYTNPKLLKEKLGGKMILSSGFPLSWMSQVSAEEAADKAKEFLDIMAADGGYMFGLDKSILCAADCRLENLEAVAKTVLEYGVYDHPGTKVGMDFRKEDYKPAGLKFESRMFKTWEQYLEENPNTPEEAKKYVMAAEAAVAREYISLLK